MPQRHIVALGGGGFGAQLENLLLEDFILSLCHAKVPKICFLPTASGDNDRYIVNFYRAFADRSCSPSHLAMFTITVPNLRNYLMAQDIIYVGGGNTANMLAIWRLHGIDRVLRDAWSAGKVLCGISAGSICWFEAGVTDSFGPKLEPLRNCLGFLGGSNCPHYDSERQRRPTYRRLVSHGFPPGLAAEDGVALHFVGNRFKQAVASIKGKKAYRVSLVGGKVVEQPLKVRYLGR
jgi:peptidase E